MPLIKSGQAIEYPENVTVQCKGRIVTVTGPRGTLTKNLKHLQLDMRVNTKKRTFTAIRWFGDKLDNACINTCLSHVRNMITGLTKGYRYKLRFAYSHFPINVSVEGQTVEIRNCFGEKFVRRAEIADGIKVYRTDVAKMKDELVLEGPDLEKVSQAAAVVHQQCIIRKKDIRKFLDGIYVQTKTHIDEVEN